MVRDYEMDSTSKQSAELPDIPLRETGTPRLVARPKIVDNQKDPEAGVRVILIHQRSSNGVWSDVPTESLATLKSGEGYKLELNSAATLKLREALDDLYMISGSEGVIPGHTKLTVGREDEIIRVQGDRARIYQVTAAPRLH